MFNYFSSCNIWYNFDRIKTDGKIITGIIATAHSPWPLCNPFILSASLITCTMSPTCNAPVTPAPMLAPTPPTAPRGELLPLLPVPPPVRPPTELSGSCSKLSLVWNEGGLSRELVKREGKTRTLFNTAGLNVHLQIKIH